MEGVTRPPTLLDADTAATYAGVKPATLRVWRHRYGLTTWQARDGRTLHSLDELAAILGTRPPKPPKGSPPSIYHLLGDL